MHEGKKPLPVQCSQCEEFFNSKFAVKRHIMLIHEKKKPFACHLCGLGFGESGKLKNHMNNKHDRSKYFECPTCRHEYFPKFSKSSFRNSFIVCFHIFEYTPRPCFPRFLGSKIISDGQKLCILSYYIIQPKISVAWRSSYDKISVDQKFWVQIGNSVVSKSVYIKAMLFKV